MAHCDDTALHLIYASDGPRAKAAAQRRRTMRQRCCFRVTTLENAADADNVGAGGEPELRWRAGAVWQEACELPPSHSLVAAVETRSTRNCEDEGSGGALLLFDFTNLR